MSLSVLDRPWESPGLSMSRTFNPPLCEPPGVEVGGGVIPPGWGVLLCAIDPLWTPWAGGTLPW
jgi:hypothetical protein